MGKLLFEDDSGYQHEIKISQVSSKSVGEGDVILASYEIGGLPIENANPVLINLKNMLEAVFPKGARVIVTAMRGGKKDVDISIVKSKKE